MNKHQIQTFLHGLPLCLQHNLYTFCSVKSWEICWGEPTFKLCVTQPPHCKAWWWQHHAVERVFFCTSKEADERGCEDVFPGLVENGEKVDLPAGEWSKTHSHKVGCIGFDQTRTKYSWESLARLENLCSHAASSSSLTEHELLGKEELTQRRWISLFMKTFPTLTEFCFHFTDALCLV